MMHDSSCGCPDCANFHPNRFANVGVPTPSDRSAEERREFEEWAVPHGLSIAMVEAASHYAGEYENMRTQTAYLAWRARIRLLEEENRELRRVLTVAVELLSEIPMPTPELSARYSALWNAQETLAGKGRKVGAPDAT